MWNFHLSNTWILIERSVNVRVTGSGKQTLCILHGQYFKPIVCCSVGIMLFEGFELGSCDCVGRTVGPLNVGLDDVDGDADGASLGSDSRVSVIENSTSRDMVDPVWNNVPRFSEGFAKK